MIQVTGISPQTAANVSQESLSPQAKEYVAPVKTDVTLEHNVLTDAELDKMLKEMQQISSNLGNKLKFSVNESLGEVVVKVVDPDTDKVIKEIPPVALQKMQIRIKEALGILFDDII